MKMLPHNFNTVKLSNAYFVMKLFQIRNSFIKNNPTFSKFVAEHLHQPGLEALLTYFLIRKIQYKRYDFLKFKKEILGDKEISINKIIELVNDNLTKKFDKESQKILLFKHFIFNTIQELERKNQKIPLETLRSKYKTLKSTSHFLQKNSYYSLISFDFNKWSLEELNNTIINYQNIINGIKTPKDFNLTGFLIENKEDIAASLEFTIVDILMKKLKAAVKETGIKHVAVAGGVSANNGLRNAFKEHAEKYGWTIYIPKFGYTTDNAAMIGITGYYKYLDGAFCTIDKPAFSKVTFE